MLNALGVVGGKLPVHSLLMTIKFEKMHESVILQFYRNGKLECELQPTPQAIMDCLKKSFRPIGVIVQELDSKSLDENDIIEE